MANRIIKESINESQGLSVTSPFAQDLFKRLITYADDHGRFNANIEIMRARLYPLEIESVEPEDIHSALIELVGVKKVSFYRSPKICGDKLYGYLPGWNMHQRLRESRGKFPEPEENLNDWYFQRFVPMSMKEKIFTRDKFSCQKCKKSFLLKNIPTRRALRLLSGALHIDHIVPVEQGGRASLENLRLLCASCNLSRKKMFTINELLEDDKVSPQSAADCRKFPPESESNPNGIQSEYEGSQQENYVNLKLKELPEKLVHDFKKIRTAHKAPLTETALKGIEREAKKAGKTLEEAIQICCERSWRGFDAEWVNKNGHKAKEQERCTKMVMKDGAKFKTPCGSMEIVGKWGSNFEPRCREHFRGETVNSLR